MLIIIQVENSEGFGDVHLMIDEDMHGPLSSQRKSMIIAKGMKP